MKKTAGFTLIELMIVIAIIGILATILIPNLLNAHTVTNKRAIQAHSSNVYKALNAALASDPTKRVSDIIASTAYGTDCMNEKMVAGAYGWSKAPGVVASCIITASSTGEDFNVVVVGDASTGSPAYVSTNGKDNQ